ncbi:MAG: MBL fold metallo-hydrolase [Candidatus Hodarchaeales archaeon]
MSAKITALKDLFTLQLRENDLAFIFLGSAGVILRTSSYSIAFDIGKTLDKSEITVIDHLDYLFITHNHWDHYRLDYASELFHQTGVHIIADSLSYEELKNNDTVNQEKLTLAGSDSFYKEYTVGNINFVALRGIHVGPINQYLVDLGMVKIYHAGDSGFWEHKKFSADIAFVPVGTARTCSPEVALGMVTDLKAKLAIPMHGKIANMKRFVFLMENVLPDIRVILPKKFELVQISKNNF